MSPRSRRQRSSGRRVGRILIILLSSAVALTSVGGWVSASYFGRNIRRSALFLGSGSQGTERKDSAGHTPLNILLIGSDTRTTAADCAIGGGCGPGANADVEMVVHLAANRTNATIMSIPRDTVTEIPQCTDPTDGHVYPEIAAAQINSSLQYGGPGCTVAAVHALTGLTIDHFAMVDFGGVVNMSDAVGGVSVCVDNNVYDTYSGLKLAKGTHVLKGVAALEFLRSRHGFGNGGDLGREDAQHVFLSALIRKLKSASTLTSPTALYDLANAATKALTVDDGLAGIPRLIALAGQLNDVPTDRITFVTMPNVPYPANTNWLSPSPAAQTLFAELRADQSLSSAPASASPSASPTTSTAPTTAAPTTAAVDPASVAVQVQNGSGYTGRAATITAALRTAGFTQSVDAGNGPAAAATALIYPAGAKAAATAVATALGLPTSALSAATTGTAVALILRVGTDWPTGTRFPASAAPTPTPTGPVVPPPGALNAAAPESCVAVGTQDTTQYGTPTQAYAANPQVPNSAP